MLCDHDLLARRVFQHNALRGGLTNWRDQLNDLDLLVLFDLDLKLVELVLTRILLCESQLPLLDSRSKGLEVEFVVLD